MIPGCNYALPIDLDDPNVDLNEADGVIVTINQNGTRADFTGEQIEINEAGNQITVYFTQADTLRFRFGPATAQVNWIVDNGVSEPSRVATDPFVISFEEQFVRKVLM